MSDAPAEWVAYRRAVSEVFHAISQPITALQCSLELALRKGRSAEELERGLRDGLENSQHLISVLGWLRKFADASEPRECSEVDMETVVQNWVLEVLPVAESLGKRIQVQYRDPEMISANRDVVYEVCMMIGDFALAMPGEEVEIVIAENAVSFSFGSKGVKVDNASDRSTLLSQAPELAVAARLVESMSGKFSLTKAGERTVINVELQPNSVYSEKTLAD